MILISGHAATQLNELMLTEAEREIVQNKQKSAAVYSYNSLAELNFELKLRTQIMEAAVALNYSRAGFASFKNSRCNEQFWLRTANGGFKLKSGVLPSVGINDIYQNGQLYAFECATAIVILLYKAVLTVIGRETFDVYFKDLYLHDWNNDSDLRLITINNKNEAYPGDVLYFKNPDYDPRTPQWQGENVVMLAYDQYYGHGIGIKSSQEMIAALNKRRKPESMTSSFLTNIVVHPDFNYLWRLSLRGNSAEEQQSRLNHAIIAKIGTNTFIVQTND